MNERKSVSIRNFEHGPCTLSPTEFHEFIEEIIRRVPEEHRHTIKIDILSETDEELPEYGPGTFQISWERPETDGERDQRIADEQSHREWLEASERREYERLKAKFGREESSE